MGFTSAEISESFEHEMDLPNMPGEAYHSIQLIRDEFLMNIQKFANSIQGTMQQLEGKPSFCSHLVKHDAFPLRRKVKSPGVFCFNV